MNKKIMVFVAVILVAFHAVCAFSLPTYSEKDGSPNLNNIQAETRQIEKEIKLLKEELHALENKRSVCVHKKVVVKRAPKSICYPCHHPFYFEPDHPIHVPIKRFSKECQEVFCKYGYNYPLPSLANYYTFGATVTTSPFLGLRSAYDASDLIINLPTMNEDLRFLIEHVKLEKQLCCLGLNMPDRPIIELGGKIEGVVFFQNHDGNSATSDIDLASSRFDILAEISKWVHGFMALSYDNRRLDPLLIGSGSRIANSRVFMSRAFITIGNLNCSPFYFTIGQMFVPYGRYATNMVTTPLTVVLGRTNARALLFGLYNCGFYSSIYVFRGDSHIGSMGINNGGINMGYEYKGEKGSINFGGGYIDNIADSIGFQFSGFSPAFSGFAASTSTENLFGHASAVNLHAEFSYEKITMFNEIVATTSKFNRRDLSFNGHGAQPGALNTELSYRFEWCTKPASISVGFGRSWEALALNLPKESVMAVFNISLWKDTIESIEFRHDNNYSSSDRAGGRTIFFDPALPIFEVASPGGTTNTLTLQVGAYF